MNMSYIQHVYMSFFFEIKVLFLCYKDYRRQVSSRTRNFGRDRDCTLGLELSLDLDFGDQYLCLYLRCYLVHGQGYEVFLQRNAEIYYR